MLEKGICFDKMIKFSCWRFWNVDILIFVWLEECWESYIKCLCFFVKIRDKKGDYLK